MLEDKDDSLVTMVMGAEGTRVFLPVLSVDAC